VTKNRGGRLLSHVLSPLHTAGKTELAGTTAALKKQDSASQKQTVTNSLDGHNSIALAATFFTGISYNALNQVLGSGAVSTAMHTLLLMACLLNLYCLLTLFAVQYYTRRLLANPAEALTFYMTVAPSRDLAVKAFILGITCFMLSMVARFLDQLGYVRAVHAGLAFGMLLYSLKTLHTLSLTRKRIVVELQKQQADHVNDVSPAETAETTGRKDFSKDTNLTGAVSAETAEEPRRLPAASRVFNF
jgi:hypothetical protein